MSGPNAKLFIVGLVALAIGLATDPERLQAIRRKLASDRLTTPLFDGSLTRHIESIYATIYERHMQDLPPSHILSGHASVA